ncbi:MAG: hypothetical protein AB8G22_11990 [Saprospiraceae bacterium]
MYIYIFGNGNLTFEQFSTFYLPILQQYATDKSAHFILCDFRGTDTLTMEFLKDKSKNVTVLHVGERPRYLADKYRTKVGAWEIKGGFTSDAERDAAAVESCTHFLGVDFNSNEKRKSGTLRNIESCLAAGKISLSKYNDPISK